MNNKPSGNTFQDLLPADTTAIDLGNGEYAVSQYDGFMTRDLGTVERTTVPVIEAHGPWCAITGQALTFSHPQWDGGGNGTTFHRTRREAFQAVLAWHRP